ncbi:YceI family protein [Streptomyces kurssanovii]|uniref:YceI family protein n=1 Tax=Streptomyces kurssanovii TaxID=67312 RepID=A0ABV3I583_9ACTN
MSLTDHSEAATGLTAAAVDGSWTLDAGASSVEFTARHFFFLPVTGSLPVRSGNAVLRGGLRRLEAEVDAAGFGTGNPNRDKAVRGPGFLDADRFPSIRFTGERLTTGGAWQVTGLIEVKGRSVPLTFTVDTEACAVSPDGTRAVVHATAELDRHACGVSAMRPLVGPRLRLRVTAAFVRTAE